MAADSRGSSGVSGSHKYDIPVVDQSWKDQDQHRVLKVIPPGIAEYRWGSYRHAWQGNAGINSNCTALRGIAQLCSWINALYRGCAFDEKLCWQRNGGRAPILLLSVFPFCAYKVPNPLQGTFRLPHRCKKTPEPDRGFGVFFLWSGLSPHLSYLSLFSLTLSKKAAGKSMKNHA